MVEQSQGDILIVDDTPANLMVLSKILSDHGFKVRPANNGQVALTIAKKALPDVILLDIQMPGLDGYETCRKLKEDFDTRDIPVIFISALDEVMDKVKAFDAGGIDYITKPFQILEVMSRVETQVRLHRQQMLLEKNIPAAMFQLDEVLSELDKLSGTDHIKEQINGVLKMLSEF